MTTEKESPNEWSKASAGMQEVAKLLWHLRSNLRTVALDETRGQAICADSLKRVAELDEAERKLSDALLTMKAQLVHLWGERSPAAPIETVLSTFVN